VTGDVLQVAARLAGRPGRAVLLSGRDAGGLGNRSIATSDPEAILEGGAGGATIRDRGGRVISESDDPLGLVDELVAGCGDVAPLVIGYLGYDAGAAMCGVEPGDRPAAPEPAIWLGRYPAYYESSGGRGGIEAASAAAALDFEARLGPSAEPGPPPVLGRLAPVTPAARYRAMFDRVQASLLAGDCYQVNLARQLRAPLSAPGDPLALLAALDRASPEPYAALIETGTATIISASPERFLHRAAGSDRLETRPIKGTRRRTGDSDRDGALRDELVASDKERAEHLMIVDLERNDLGRIAVTGSVVVERFADVVELPTLYHLESTVSCRVRPGTSLTGLLAATFPGGSITGAPRLRAMEIIAELEPAGRGVYTGAIGALGGRGAVDLAIAIRTAVLCPSALTLHVGGGVVVDSRCERELEETEEKAESWRRALVMCRVP
jgi:anthranilate/para-aminobenzoate synthase component I